MNKGEIIIYQTDDGSTSLDVKLEQETIWLTQKQIAELFGTKRPAITKHLKNIFQSGELEENLVCSILEHTTRHGAIANKTQTLEVKYYNLDAILSVGYRVNSTLFPLVFAQRKTGYNQQYFCQLSTPCAFSSSAYMLISKYNIDTKIHINKRTFNDSGL